MPAEPAQFTEEDWNTVQSCEKLVIFELRAICYIHFILSGLLSETEDNNFNSVNT